MYFTNITYHKALIYLLVIDALIIAFTLVSTDDPKIYYDEFHFVTFVSTIKLFLISRLNWLIFRSKGGNIRNIDLNSPYVLWLITSAGFAFLALDDLFLIHENTDKLVHILLGMKETGVSDRIDDLIVFVYGILGILILYSYREEVYRYKAAIPFIMIGFIMLFVRIAIDIVTNRNDIIPLYITDSYVAGYLNNVLAIIEGATKLLAESFFITAFYYCLRNVRTKAS